MSRTVPRDPLANFLFVRKQGHCEYFASSMAVMLRTLGIPSRMVNGFRTGEFNDLTSQYVVRASNAHSWVEAYFPNYGWVAFDPTPGASIPVRTGWSRMSLYVDAMASFWREWIVNYDVVHQQSLAVTASSRSRQLFWALRAWWHRHYESLLASARHTGSAVAGSPLRWGLGGAADRGPAFIFGQRAAAFAGAGRVPPGVAAGTISSAGGNDLVPADDEDRGAAWLAQIAEPDSRRVRLKD